MPIVTPAEATELKKDGKWRSDRHPVALNWGDVCYRPDRHRPRPGDSSKNWIRCAADERAVADGCWFDEAQAEYVADWFRTHLRHCIGEWTGKRWVVSISKEEGAPSLAEQAAAAEAARLSKAASHPRVSAVLKTFPGAEIETVRELAGGPASEPGTGDSQE